MPCSIDAAREIALMDRHASALQRLGCVVDGGADADISRAAAEIAAHRDDRCPRSLGFLFSCRSATALITWPDWQ